jgi:adenylosuccinate synthase
VRDTLAKEAFLHEVSQGFALSLNSGTHYPFCTSRECTPQQAYADFGLLPSMIGDVYLNVRSKPIRVGNNYDQNGVMVGYSGDCLSDQHELTWEQVGVEAEMPADEIAGLAERERTTVTKKIRRVYSESWQLLTISAKFCGATKLVLNFPQYIHWSSYKLRGGNEILTRLHYKVRNYLDKMQEATNLSVIMIGTGPDHNDYIYFD